MFCRSFYLQFPSRIAALWLVLAAHGMAAPRIWVGTHSVLPNTPNQTFQVLVDGGPAVAGVNFNLQLADGGPEAGGRIDGPELQAVDLITGTIFADQAGPVTVLSTNYPQLALYSILTPVDPETPSNLVKVMAEGVLATVTVDTTGFPTGIYRLRMRETRNGPTDFVGESAEIIEGQLIVGTPSLRIDVGDHVLLPDTPGQTIPIRVQGGADVAGLNFNLQVEDAGAAFGGSRSGPAITSVDLVNGTIFDGNHEAVQVLTNAPQLVIHNITVASSVPNNAVAATGLLAIVTIDTTGFTNGVFSLRMGDTLNGLSDFAGQSTAIYEGRLTIEDSEPPPAPDLSIRWIPGGVELSFNPDPARDHFIEYRTSPPQPPGWSELSGGPFNTGVAMDLSNADIRRYFRLRVENRP
jgi:hypothetical protein